MKKTNRRQFIAGMAALGLTKAVGIVRAGQTVQTEQPAEIKKTVLPFVPGSWSLVVLPDTQNYSTLYPGLFNLQTQWANQVLDKYHSHKAIILTHAYLYHDSTRYDWQ